MSDSPYRPPRGHEQNLQYRSISKAAVLSVVFAVLGLMYFIGVIFAILPILAIGFGLHAHSSCKKYPEELTGRKAALIGLALSVLTLLGAGGMHAYIYSTEVPEGYQRISFYDLKPNTKTQLWYSEKADDFDGKKVFLKGYVRPGDKKYELSSFIMVGDWGDCCFGGNPEITDVVGVSITTDDTVNYSLGLRRIGGTFRVNKNPLRTNDDEVPQIVYEIHADYVK